MAYRKLADIPYQKRPRGKVILAAKTVKAQQPARQKVIKRKGAREWVSLGTMELDEIAPVVKGWRQAHKDRSFQVLIIEGKDVVARSHFLSGRTTLPETEVLGMIQKYRLKSGQYDVVLTLIKKNYESIANKWQAPKKTKVKKPTKKKMIKKSANKKSAKKPPKKKQTKKPTKKR